MREIDTKVVGVTRSNRDGTSRQELIQGLKEGDLLHLFHDDENEHDPNIVQVHCECEGWFGRKGFPQLGFLRREIAKEVTAHLADYGEAFAVVSSLTGGGPDQPTRGVNIRLFLREEVEEEKAPK